jgi:transposase
MLAERLTAPKLARRYDVSRDTAARWLADAGLSAPDSLLHPERLRVLYVEQGATVRQIASVFGVGKNRVLRALSAAGIQPRPRSAHPRRGPELIQDAELREAYVHRRMTLAEIAEQHATTLYYVRSRVRELGLVKRRGSHTPRSCYERDELPHLAAKLYEQVGSMAAVAAELGVSTEAVRQVLHAAQAPVRLHGRGLRTVVDELYADDAVIAVLRRHEVTIPEDGWRPGTPWRTYAPQPLAFPLLRELYHDVGLPIAYIAMLCGVGQSTVRKRLTQGGVALRPSARPAPWSVSQRQRHGAVGSV